MGGRTWLRLQACALLSASGLLTVLAERARWWPACRRGQFDTPRCAELQDHRFDQVLPSEPWEPLPAVGWLAGSGLVLLGLAVATLGVVVASAIEEAALRRQVLAVGALLGAAPLGVGVATAASAQLGRPVGLGVAEVPLGVVWAVLCPFGLFGLAIVWMTVPRTTPVSGLLAKLVVMFALVLSSPLVSFFVGSVLAGYMSHDTTPWSGAAAGIALLVAGLAAWPATGGALARHQHGEVGVAGTALELDPPAL